MARDNATDAVHILDGGSASRKELAAALGISQSGAGNVAAQLISSGIASEYDGKPDSRSKTCGILYLRRDPVFAVSDVTAKTVTTYIFGYSLAVTDSFVFNIEDPLFLDDCLSTYFRMLSAKCPKLRLLSIVSNGDPHDGRFHGSGIPRFDDLPLSDMATEHLGDNQVVLLNRFGYIPDTAYGLSLIVSDDGDILNTAIVHNGIVISRKDMTGRLGESEISCRSFNSAIKYAGGFDQYTDTIASFIYEMICLVDADRIIYIGDRYSDCNAVMTSVKERMILRHGLAVPDIPHIVPLHHSDLILSKELRRNLRDGYVKSLQ